MHEKKISFIWRWSLINLFGRKLCCTVSVKVRKTKVSNLRKFTDAYVQPWLASMETMCTCQTEHRACCSIPLWNSCPVKPIGSLNFSVRSWFCSWTGCIAACFPTLVSNLPARWRVMGAKSRDGEEDQHGVLEQSWVKRRSGRRLFVLSGGPVKRPGPLALDSEYSPSSAWPTHPYWWHLITCRQPVNYPPN